MGEGEGRGRAKYESNENRQVNKKRKKVNLKVKLKTYRRIIASRSQWIQTEDEPNEGRGGTESCDKNSLKFP